MTTRSSLVAPMLRLHEPAAAAISALLYPHAEVVLHDLASGCISAIWNAFSGRRPGMDSLVEAEFPPSGTDEKVLGPYEKTGTDGRRLKSVTAVLRDDAGTAVGLLCINMDVSRIDDAVKLLAAFAGTPGPRPASLFEGDWREAINNALHAWLKGQGLALSALKRKERVAMVGELDRAGLFRTRNAVEHLAGLIGSSRASIYNYLAEARGEAKKER
ncbi:PAS domain-containing protein [Rhizobium sp. TRM95111]|uniref:helix-turn-helix transcriptional regulator n=1 Tax=Rhizobium alarense TaxID=2846851 RepID=UPI001F1935DC|nr:PAS domain-containing protein [Rhizobium alarense]MCF3640893.1 PAS domain-containing protein [Rhizobium alarense]